ncbi:Serine threonine-kinase dst1 [Micractinium conductrix]|uniref:non-specific serine/threonine protein kinase n=1 Tax=Micractinium conductrix TaxID=554055 RepID=A0A2P6V0W1_9CHLO|nr:Serine threonine-kinase dst1 [Micractinium conductrix]|eukprot:PSC67730.1 Serine threonine-kinase dst1 [Micractinium conductrix]
MGDRADAVLPPPAWRRAAADADAVEHYTDPFKIFELIHPLGRGSYGAVHKARILASGDIVAVKIIPVGEAEELAAIQKEIAILRECNHPNVVKYYGSWRTRDSLWICMEYCAGGSVSDIMHTCGGGLEEEVIAYISGQTLAGLSYLHTMGKVHRDIKCGNILLTEAGEVKLADFGVAAQLTNTMSKRNTFIGTPHWMAPEVIQVSQYDGKVDIWALGISTIEMAEQFPPRWRVNPNRVIFQVVKDPPPRLADKERWSLTFQDFVAQCLQKDPRTRPTARYLQQHKFTAREGVAGAAVKALLPLVQQARTHMAEMALMAGIEAQQGAAGPADDGAYTWHEARGTLASPAQQPSYMPAYGGAAGTLVAAQQQHLQPPAGGYQGTVAASTPHPRVSEGGGAAAYAASPQGLGREDGRLGGTVVVRQSVDSGGGDGWGATVVSSVQPSPAGHRAGFGGTLQVRGSPGAAASPAPLPGGMAGEASRDYMAAVQAMEEGAVELAVSGLPTPGGRLLPAAKAPQTEAQRWVEKLHTLYSSGAVVPLPFLRATDAAPLALLGIDKGPPGAPPAAAAAEAQELGWEQALQEVVAESGNGSSEEGVGELPEAIVTAVAGSPALLNLAASLAHHKRLLAALAAQQAAAGDALPARLREQLRAKADDLATTLRTILCL